MVTVGAYGGPWVTPYFILFFQDVYIIFKVAYFHTCHFFLMVSWPSPRKIDVWETLEKCKYHINNLEPK